MLKVAKISEFDKLNMAERTFTVQHNQNCASPFLVRFVGYMRGYIDSKPYMSLSGHLPEGGFTTDALGFGKTFEEAALEAQNALDRQKENYNKKPPNKKRI